MTPAYGTGWKPKGITRRRVSQNRKSPRQDKGIRPDRSLIFAGRQASADGWNLARRRYMAAKNYSIGSRVWRRKLRVMGTA